MTNLTGLDKRPTISDYLTNLTKTMKAIETSYNGLRFRSRIEARWAVFYDALGVRYQYEEQGFDLGGLYYLPDFWLPDYEVWVEIKGEGSPSDEDKEKVRRLALETRYPALIFSGSFTSNTPFEDFGMPVAGWLWYYLRDNKTDKVEFEEHADEVDLGRWGYCERCGKPKLDFGVFFEDNYIVVWPDGKEAKNRCGHRGKRHFADHPLIHRAYTAARKARFEHGETIKPVSEFGSPMCPKCGAFMVKREPKFGQSWDPFWGCPNYPDCKGSRPLVEGLPYRLRSLMRSS